MIAGAVLLLGAPDARARQDPTQVIERLERHNRALTRAAAPAPARRRASGERYDVAVSVPGDGLGPDALSDAEAVRGAYALELDRQRACTRLAMAPPGEQSRAVYARRGLGCGGARFD